MKADGSGETIALIEAYHDPTLASDLKTFDQMYKLPDPSLSVINQAGGQTNSGWAGEDRSTSSGLTRFASDEHPGG